MCLCIQNELFFLKPAKRNSLTTGSVLQWGVLSAKPSVLRAVEQVSEIWVWVCCTLCVMTSYPVYLLLFFYRGLHPKWLRTSLLRLPLPIYTSLEAVSRKVL